MKLIKVVQIYNMLSGANAGSDVQVISYVIKTRKQLKNAAESYFEFEREAAERVTDATSGKRDDDKFLQLVMPERLSESDVTFDAPSEEVLVKLMAANPNIPAGAWDILIDK